MICYIRETNDKMKKIISIFCMYITGNNVK